LRTPRRVTQISGTFYFRWHGGMFYWVSGGSILRLNGATTEYITSTGDVSGSFIEVDDEAVYYRVASDAGPFPLRRAKLDRSGSVNIVPDVRSRFLLDGDRIYFDSPDGKLVSTLARGGGSIDPVTGPPSVQRLFTVSGVLIDATHLYWNDGPDSDVTLMRVAKGTSNVETVASHLPGPAVLLQGDSVLLVAEQKYILDMPKSGGCPLWLTTGTSSIVADDKAVYWATTFGSDTADLLLYRVPRHGGATIEVLGVPSGLRGGLFGPAATVLTPTQVLIGTETTSNQPGVWVLDRPYADSVSSRL